MVYGLYKIYYFSVGINVSTDDPALNRFIQKA